MFRRKRRNAPPIFIGGIVIVAIALLVYFLLPKGQRDRVVQPGAAVAQQQTSPPKAEVSEPAPLVRETPKPLVAEQKPPAVERPILEIGQGAAAERIHRISAPDPQPPKLAQTPVPASPPPAPVPQPQKVEAGPVDAIASVAAARQKEQSGDLVAARLLYSRALLDGKLMPSEQETVRQQLTKINEDLVFSTKVTKDDPYADSYVVQSGDRIIKINQKLNLAPDYRLIQRLNRIPDSGNLRLGQRLKVIKGPFHVVVHKSIYRLDLYMGPPDKRDEWLYIRSFTVGLGEGNSTPIGDFIVRKGSKLVNPPWVNPRTGEKFEAGPTCPIGKFWIGLEGVGESASSVGYGLHGTIDPDSIGKQKSMGCVRLASDDIGLLYELLGEQLSNVKIEP